MITGENYIYVMRTDTLSHTVFMESGLGAVTSYIGSTTVGAKSGPTDAVYTECNMLQETGSESGIAGTGNAYLQNAFVFDGYMNPAGFDIMRRLCFMWNNKTESYPK